MAFAVLVPTYNQVVFFRFFEDDSYIIKIFILFGDIAADKSMSRAVGFPHRAIKVVSSSFFIIILHRFSGDDDFVVIHGEDFSYVVGLIGVRLLKNARICREIIRSQPNRPYEHYWKEFLKTQQVRNALLGDFDNRDRREE